MLATAQSHCATAASSRARWPSCSVPMVGARPSQPLPARSRQAVKSATVCSTSMRKSSVESVLRVRIGAAFHGLHIGRHGGLDAVRLLHEILHETRFAPRRYAENVVNDQNLAIG